MKTYHVFCTLPPMSTFVFGRTVDIAEELYAIATFDYLWKASKFSKVAELSNCPSLIIDATDLTNANS